MEHNLLQNVSSIIQKSFFRFKPSSLFIITWDGIGYRGRNKVRYNKIYMFVYPQNSLAVQPIQKVQGKRMLWNSR